MSFVVRMNLDTVSVEAGSSVPIAFEVKNEGDARDHYEVVVEGLDQQWVALPTVSLQCEPGQSHVERFFIKPPRESESVAGNHPFVLRVRSLESGEMRTAQGMVEIKPFYHLSLDMTPKRATVSPTDKAADFEVAVMNLGNVEQNLQIFANDLDDQFAYDVSDPQLSLGPGQQRTVNVTATGTKMPVLASSSLSVVTVTARNATVPAVASSTQAQVERRGLVTPGAFFAVLAILALVVGWALTIPKPPSVASFALSKDRVTVGESVTVSWRAGDADSVTLIYGEETKAKLPTIGNFTFTPTAEGDMVVELIAISENRKSEPERLTLGVVAPEVAPDPKIESFRASSREVDTGSVFTLNYELNAAVTYAYIEPLGAVDPRAKAMQVNAPNDVGETVYTLIARNEDGKEVRDQVRVRFVKNPRTTITTFEVTPLEMDPSDMRITAKWEITGAVRAVLTVGTQTMEVELPSGTRDFMLTGETPIKLVAFDSEGLQVTREVTVKLKKIPNDPPLPGDGSQTPPGTTGTTGGPTGAPTGTTGTPPPTGTGNTRAHAARPAQSHR